LALARLEIELDGKYIVAVVVAGEPDFDDP
jgi:hypothetical protein